MRTIMKRKMLFLIFIIVFLFLSGCGKAEESEKIDLSKIKETLQEISESETIQKEKIQNNFSVLGGNNPNNKLMGRAFAYDENYVYWISSKPGIEVERPKLCRMMLDGSEYEELMEVEDFSNVCVQNGFLYYTIYNRIGCIDLNTFAEEKNMIEIPIADNIKRGNIEYEAYSYINSLYAVDNRLLYSYSKGYKGTSSNEYTAQAIYNIQTGQITEMDIDFVFRQLAYDGENIYVYGNDEIIRVIPVQELSDGNTTPLYKQVIIKDKEDVKYIASNGMVIAHEDGSVAFYDFETCRNIEDGGIWKGNRIEQQGSESIFQRNANGVILFLTDFDSIFYAKKEKELEFFENYMYKENTAALDFFVAGGVANDKVYCIGYDESEQLVSMIADAAGNVSTNILKGVVLKQEPEQNPNILVPEQYVDLKQQAYDSGNGITIEFTGHSYGSIPIISLRITNNTGHDLNLEMIDELLVNGRVKIGTELLYGLRPGFNGGVLQNGESTTQIRYQNADLESAGENYFSLDSVYFKFHFTATEGTDVFEHTTSDIAIIYE